VQKSDLIRNKGMGGSGFIGGLHYIIIDSISKIEFTGSNQILEFVFMYSRTCIIRHTKGPGKCAALYMMSEYSGFILVNRTTLRP
jgi:hypothetical protein